MHTEEHFQKALGQNPLDFHLRLVFADWLEERGDERALSYRALGLRIWSPWSPYDRNSYFKAHHSWWNWHRGDHTYRIMDFPDSSPEEGELPINWHTLVDKFRKLFDGRKGDHSDVIFPTARDANNCAAFAFSKLPLEEQTLLLHPTLSSAQISLDPGV